MAERLTKKIVKTVQDKYSLGQYLYYDFAGLDDTNKLLNKLGKLEDILEKYGIGSVEELSNALEFAKVISGILSEYGVNDNEELEYLLEKSPKFVVKDNAEKCGQEINGVFFSNEQMLILSQYNELQEPYKKRYEQVKTDRDTWKRACELACETLKQVMGKPLWIGGNIPTPEVKDSEYFYQQAKKENK